MNVKENKQTFEIHISQFHKKYVTISPGPQHQDSCLSCSKCHRTQLTVTVCVVQNTLLLISNHRKVQTVKKILQRKYLAKDLKPGMAVSPFHTFRNIYQELHMTHTVPGPEPHGPERDHPTSFAQSQKRVSVVYHMVTTRQTCMCQPLRRHTSWERTLRLGSC